MSDLYIQKSDLKLSLFEEKIIIRTVEREIIKEISIKKIDNILVFGHAQLTTQLVKKLAREKINIYYFSAQGQFLSHLESFRSSDFEKQHQQAKMTMTETFSLEIARKIAESKVQNQINLLKAYDKDSLLDKADYERFDKNITGIRKAASVSEIMGFEGRQAKSYFYYLNLLVPDSFHFYGRSRRPANDMFNTMLNFGYGILYSFFIGMIRKHGLSPGFAMIHLPHAYHATLASDLMEEWRPVIVDDTVMKLIRHQLITAEMFEEKEEGRILLTTEGRKVFSQEMQARLLEIHNYVETDKKRYTFPYMVNMQLLSLIRAFREENPDLYLTGFTGDGG